MPLSCALDLSCISLSKVSVVTDSMDYTWLLGFYMALQMLFGEKVICFYAHYLCSPIIINTLPSLESHNNL